jgi:hypothetical protein
MRLSTTSYRHGYSCDQRGSSTGVKSYFLLLIPGWEGKTCHYTHHIAHYFATYHPRGRIRQGPYPTILRIRPYPPCPRPGLDPASAYYRSAGRKGRRGTELGVFSPSHPLHHHGVQGWLAIPEARRYTHLHKDRQNPPERHPQRPSLLLLYKRADQGSTKKEEGRSQAQASKGRRTTNYRQQKINLLLYFHFSFETWARFPLSQLVTPTQALRCKKIQFSPSLLDVGPSLARTRIKPPCILLASPSRSGTHSI